MSDPVITSQSGKVGDQGDQLTITLESFVAMPNPPGDAIDVNTTYEDGKYVCRYTILVDGAPATYQITGGVSQEPLATHPMFGPNGDWTVPASEWKNWKIWEADPHDADLGGWKPDADGNSDGMKKFYAYRNRGIEDYLLGTVTMRVTTEQSNSPSLDNLGHIEQPPGAPALPDGRNWLCVGVDGERTAFGANLWKVSREYRASAAGGWDPDIYANS